MLSVRDLMEPIDCRECTTAAYQARAFIYAILVDGALPREEVTRRMEHACLPRATVRNIMEMTALYILVRDTDEGTMWALNPFTVERLREGVRLGLDARRSPAGKGRCVRTRGSPV